MLWVPHLTRRKTMTDEHAPDPTDEVIITVPAGQQAMLKAGWISILAP